MLTYKELSTNILLNQLNEILLIIDKENLAADEIRDFVSAICEIIETLGDFYDVTEVIDVKKLDTDGDISIAEREQIKNDFQKAIKEEKALKNEDVIQGFKDFCDANGIDITDKEAAQTLRDVLHMIK